jgi:hypothetical protein
MVHSCYTLTRLPLYVFAQNDISSIPWMDHQWRDWTNNTMAFSLLRGNPNCSAQNNWPTLQLKFSANNWICVSSILSGENVHDGNKWQSFGSWQHIYNIQMYWMVCYYWSYTPMVRVSSCFGPSISRWQVSDHCLMCHICGCYLRWSASCLSIGTVRFYMLLILENSIYYA